MTTKAEHLRRIADLLKLQWERAAQLNAKMPDAIAQNEVDVAEIAWRLAEVAVIDGQAGKT